MSDMRLELIITGDGKVAVRELGQVEAAERKVEGATKSSSSTTRAARTELESYMSAVRREVETLGMSRAQIRLYEAARMGATQADLRAIEAANELAKAHERSGGAMTSMLGLVTRGIAGVAGVTAALTIGKYLAETADNAALLQARLKLVTNGLEEQRRVQQDLFQISQDLRLPYNELANSFPRIARAIREVGGSTSDAVAIQRIFAETVRISGANTQEAAASALQFSQALSSGRLGGDELRSVLENNARLAKALADGLGVSVGELRHLGEEGKLTTEKILAALMSQKDVLEREATSLPNTIKGSWTALGNEMDKTTASSVAAASTTSVLTTSFDLLAAAIKKARDNGAAFSGLPIVGMMLGLSQQIDGREAGGSWNRAEDARFGRQAGAADQDIQKRAAALKDFKELIKEVDTAAGINAKYETSVTKIVDVYAKLARAGALTAKEEEQLREAIQLEGVKRQQALEQLAKRGQASLQSDAAVINARAELQTTGNDKYYQGQQDLIQRALQAEEFYHRAALTGDREYIDQKAALLEAGARNELSRLENDIAISQGKIAQLRALKPRDPTEANQNTASIAGEERNLSGLREKLTVATRTLKDVEVNRGREVTLLENKIRDAVIATTRAKEDYIRSLDREVEDAQLRIELLGRDEAGQAKANAAYQLTNRMKEERLKIERQIADLRRKNGSEEEIEALEKALEAMEGKTAETILTVTRSLDKEFSLKNQISAVNDFADRFSSAIGDMAVDWKHGLASMEQVGVQFWREMVALFAKKLILQMGGQIIGGQAGAALISQAGGLGQGTFAGSALSGIGGWLGGTSMGSSVGQFWGGMTGTIAGPAQQGSALAMGQSVAGSMSTILWVAAIVAAMYKNNELFTQGWRADGQDSTARFWANATPAGPLYVFDSALRGIGLSDRMASLITGSSFNTRLVGHGPTHPDAFGLQGTVTGNGFTGTQWQDLSQQGGVFRQDNRWTEHPDMTGPQSRLIESFLAPVRTLISSLGERLGVDPNKALAGYSHDFNVQLTENGQIKSDEEIKAIFNELFAKVLQEQVSKMFDAGGKTGLAEYVRSLDGSGEEISNTIQALLACMDTVKALGDVIDVLEGGPLVALKQQLKSLKDNVDAAQKNFDRALETKDPAQVLAAEQQLQQAIMARYEQEIAMVEQLREAMRALKEQAYQFSIMIAGKINSVGGSRDIGGMALSHAMQLQGGIGGNLNVGGQLTDLGNYVGAIDTWYQSRYAAIQQQMAAEQQAAAAIAQAQQAAAQARIAALQKELALAQAFQGLVDKTREMIGELKLGGSSPQALSARFALAGSEVERLKAAYDAAKGQDRIEIANQLLAAIATYRGLGEQLYQRPSPEWEATYNDIMRTLTEVQGSAETEAQRTQHIQEQILLVQQQAAAAANSIAVDTSVSSSMLDALNTEALGYYTWAEQQGTRLFTLQEQAFKDQLDLITGGQDIDLFIASMHKEEVAQLKILNANFQAYLNSLGVAAPGTGTTPGGSTGTPAGGGPGGSGTGSNQPLTVGGNTVVMQFHPKLSRAEQYQVLVDFLPEIKKRLVHA